MDQGLLLDIVTLIAAFLAHFLGIRIGGNAALRAASPDLDSKAKFPWGKVVQAFLEFLLSLTRMPGILVKEKANRNGDNR
jgi:hypothetical protein